MGDEKTALDLLDVLIKHNEDEFEAARASNEFPDLSNEENEEEG